MQLTSYAETLLKIIPVGLACIGTLKLVYDWMQGSRSKIREEYKFAKEFLKDVKNEHLHPYAKQLGYQAIAGDKTLSVSEIEYLLSLQDSASALSDYVLGKPYLQHFSTANGRKITFAPRFQKKWSRKWRLYTYLLLYFVFFMCAFSPFYASKVFSLSYWDAITYLPASIATFSIPTITALRASIRIFRAEALLDNQYTATK